MGDQKDMIRLQGLSEAFKRVFRDVQGFEKDQMERFFVCSGAKRSALRMQG